MPDKDPAPATKFIKEEENKTQQFILQKNSKTKIASIIITFFLVILVIGIIASGVFIG